MTLQHYFKKSKFEDVKYKYGIKNELLGWGERGMEMPTGDRSSRVVVETMVCVVDYGVPGQLGGCCRRLVSSKLYKLSINVINVQKCMMNVPYV